MKRMFILLILALAPALFAPSAWAIDQAMPSQSSAQPAATPDADAALEHAKMERFQKQDRTGFQKQIQLDQFRLLGIQNLDQVKIIDSWARQSLRKIRHRESIDGQDPVYTALDMAFRPEAWFSKNIIYVESVPIREELGRIANDPKEAKRIREEALISPLFFSGEDVQQRLNELGVDSRQTKAVNQVNLAAGTFFSMADSLLLVPPPASDVAAPWIQPKEITDALLASFPPPPSTAPGAIQAASQPAVPDTLAYPLKDQTALAASYQIMKLAWQDNDAAKVNREGIVPLVALLPTIDPAVYPTATRAQVELWYNRTFSGTLDAFIYFLAMVLFFQVAIGNVKRAGKVQKTALAIYAVALIGHLSAMGVRWWIDGRIPIQNEFESVMGSAAIGCCIGLILESWKKNGIFGAAFGFVGFLSGAALLAVPYVFGTDVGSAPGKVAGILNTYWLYIHVDVVIASYALISASFVIAATYLIMRQWHWINPIEPGFDEAAGGGGSPSSPNRAGVKILAAEPVSGGAQPALTSEQRLLLADRSQLLDTLDQANMVILQMAFWFLGIGVICGAVWADQSWGRPWGWDPKETFALVTWMVYLVIVHIRLVVKHKADMTAWLSVAGFAIMMFNWIGVNFFLKGLHSYA